MKGNIQLMYQTNYSTSFISFVNGRLIVKD